MHVSIPRYMLVKMNLSFSLQEQWAKRLQSLCGMFDKSVGYMKMDACDLLHAPSILSGNGSFYPGFSRRIPDTAWAMCFTGSQIDALGGLEFLQNSQLFHHIEPLANGSVYLQLTSDISNVTKDKAAMLWQLISPQLETTPVCWHDACEVPMSFRLGIQRDQLQVDQYGQYRFVL